MIERPVRVVKLGGSLLDYDLLVPAFQGWLAAQPAMKTLVVAGGGKFADAVRDASKRHGLGEVDAHWLCIRLLDITAELVSRLLVGSRLFDRLESFQADDGPPIWILQPLLFLQSESQWHAGPTLPHQWQVTSDSIAARVAAVVNAAELVLLKSALPRGATPSSWADDGYVDAYFPAALAGVNSIRCVNLRSFAVQGR